MADLPPCPCAYCHGADAPRRRANHLAKLLGPQLVRDDPFCVQAMNLVLHGGMDVEEALAATVQALAAAHTSLLNTAVQVAMTAPLTGAVALETPKRVWCPKGCGLQYEAGREADHSCLES